MTKNKDKNLFQKLTRLFKSGPVVKRKIRTLDTAIAVPDKTKSSGALLFQKSMAPTYATITANAYNLSERLMRYQDFCFGRETLVYTLEGVYTIEELSQKYKDGEQFFVYSYDYENKQPTIGKAFFPRVANGGEKTKRVKITFDDGGSICLTPDHKVILRDGSTFEAGSLKVGDSLMPLYVSDINGYGYNWIYMLGKKTPISSGWLQEHVFVARELLRAPIEGEDVHHKDFNRQNNHPSNLAIMSEHDHMKFHAQINNVNKFGKPNSAHSKWMKENGNRRSDLTFESIVSSCLALKTMSLASVSSHLSADFNAIKLRLREAGFKNWKDFTSRFDEAQAKSTHNIIVKESKTPTLQEIIDSSASVNSLEELACVLSCTKNAIGRRLESAGYANWTEFKTGTAYSGKKKGKKYSGPSYQDICSKFKQGMSKTEIASACETTHNKIMTCIKNNGFSSYSSWTDTFENHKVAAIEDIEDDVVYTITVEKYHNLAVGSLSPKNDKKRKYSMVFCTQCEMEYTPEIASALDIYADEAVSSDDKGRALHVYSDNEKIKEVLEELFYDTLNVEFNLRAWTRNLVKYGDMFLYNDVSPTHGVINAFPIPVNEVEREENYDPNDPMAFRFRWVTLGNRTLENWEVSHFRLLGNDMFLPYGASVIEPARRIWRQLILIEDAMLVYRVVRAPERRVFYIDVANIPPENVPMYIEEQRKNLRSSQVIDQNTGRVDLRYNPLSVDEDYFIGVRGGESGTKIDTLVGGQNTAAVEDVAYIQKKLFAALKIPRAYLGYDESLSSKATLAQEDIRFSRTINVIQKTMIAELNKLAIIHLYANGFDADDLQNFTLRLSNPSTVAQQQKLELWRMKFEIAGTAPEGYVSKEFVRKEIWGLNEEQCSDIDEQRMNEKVVDDAIEKAAAEDEGGGEAGGGGGEDLFGTGGGGEEESGGEEEPAGGGEEEAGGGGTEELTAADDVDEKEPELNLLLSSDDPDDSEDFPVKLSLKDRELPIKAQTQLDKALYKRSRIKHNGSSKTHIPDYGKMLKSDNKSFTDPFDSDFTKSYVSNPFGESVTREKYKTVVSNDVLYTLKRMSERFGIQRNDQSNKTVIVESAIEDDVADAKEFREVLTIDEDED